MEVNSSHESAAAEPHSGAPTEADAAAEEWRKALEVEPDNVPARMYLRISMAERSLEGAPDPAKPVP